MSHVFCVKLWEDVTFCTVLVVLRGKMKMQGRRGMERDGKHSVRRGNETLRRESFLLIYLMVFFRPSCPIMKHCNTDQTFQTLSVLSSWLKTTPSSRGTRGHLPSSHRNTEFILKYHQQNTSHVRPFSSYKRIVKGIVHPKMKIL